MIFEHCENSFRFRFRFRQTKFPVLVFLDSEKTRNYEKGQKQIGRLLQMMSLILLDELLRVRSQDSSNKIKPLFTIKQTRGLSSVRTSFRVFSGFSMLSQ